MVKAPEPVRTQAPGVWPEESARKQSGIASVAQSSPALQHFSFFQTRSHHLPHFGILLCGLNWPRMCNDPPSSAS